MTDLTKHTEPNSGSPRIRRLVDDVGFEVLPLKNAEAAVLASVPSGVRVTVTASPAKGLAATIDLAERLSNQGVRVAPHLPARLVHSRAEVQEVLGRLAAANITDAFVVGGDNDPVGEFTDALGLLQAMTEVGHGLTEIGIGGYPEGHASISDEQLWQALVDKAPFATRIVTQICFDADVIVKWAEQVRARGIELPIYVGVPGAVSRQKLIRITTQIGLGASARFLTKQQGMFWRFFLPSGYSPARLVTRLEFRRPSSSANLAGLHLFTFNEVAPTEQWRTQMLNKGDKSS